ncbi:hypothetical protein [Arthrobacter sp. GMC3]|uniref:VG15 protein n=1 Tax=Arthrobacter sp. GMC3 TaxID=2058894 RepID=UPI000CE5531D|nr:hypothetical protein [Arthrobacter sp. GMC3]
MALTAEGRELTEAHRLLQLGIAARATAVSKSLWRRLQVSDLDGSMSSWMPAQLAAWRLFYGQSQEVASEYITAYQAAEIGAASKIVQQAFGVPEMRDAALLAGPVRVKMLIKRGMAADEAHSKAFTKFSGITRRQVMSGGRLAVAKTGSADQRAVGWRRVTDGDPCTFCGMLAGRGPIYSSKQRADSIGGTGLEYHGHCGCTAEIVYGDWEPSDSEKLFIEEYDKAAKQADAAGESRTQENVLWRMRENGTFRDSPLARNK